MPKFKTHKRVEFADTDAAGIAHFASFFRYFEEAEHAMLRSVGLGVLDFEIDGAHVSWPRVAVSCEYQSMAKFEDVLDVEIWVAKIGTKSATYQCEFRLGERLVATGRTTACCVISVGGKPEAISIPSSYADGLRTLQP